MGLINFSCPTCGGKLTLSDTTNQLVCENCGNKYIAQQKGSQISLIPATGGDGATIVGNSNVIVQVNTTANGDKSGAVKKIDKVTEPTIERVECPLCGKLVNRENTFRCKNCQRPSICIEHQDKASYLCVECTQLIRKNRNTNSSKSLGILSLVFSIIAAICIGFFVSNLEWYTSMLRASERLPQEILQERASPTLGDWYLESLEQTLNRLPERMSEVYNVLRVTGILGLSCVIIALASGIPSIVLGKRKTAWFGVIFSIISGISPLIASLIFSMQ